MSEQIKNETIGNLSRNIVTLEL